MDRWPNAAARARVTEVFQRLSTLQPAALGAEELTPEELPFLRFEPAAQAVFDAWRADLEQTLRGEAEHPVWRSHVAKYRSLMPSLALIGHLIDGVAGGPTGPVSRAAAARAVAWCTYLLTNWEGQTMKDLVPLATAIAGMGLAMWVLHSVVELWW